MSVDEIVEWARYAEKKGYGYIFRSDHLLPTAGNESRDSPECWVTLGAIAASTQSIRFGPMVSPVAFRNPALLAKMACTLDAYSRGRLLLGMGGGWFEGEYRAHGFEFPRFRVRMEQLDEALQIVRPLTEGRRVEFDGKHFHAHTDCLPKPVRKVHLIVGGKNAGVVELAAKHADEWNTYSIPADNLRRVKLLLDSKLHGKRVIASQMGSFVIADSKGDLERRVRNQMRARGMTGDFEVGLTKLRMKGLLCGTPEEFLSQLNKLLELGVERFYFQILDRKDRDVVNLLTETLKQGLR